MKRFLELSRAPFLTAIITPLIFGTALAYRTTGEVDWLRFVVALIGLAAAHAGANLFNDYFDYMLGADQKNRHRSQFSGGSPHLVEGREKSRTFLLMALAATGVALAAGGVLMWLVDGGPGPVLWLTLAGLGLGFFYTAPPMKLAYRGVGELCVFLGFGPLPVLGAWYIQTGFLGAVPFVASLPLSMLITNIIWINQFPDWESDRAAGKHHLVVRMGRSLARWVYHGLGFGAFVLIALFSLKPLFGAWGFLGLVALPAVVAASMVLHRRFEEPAALLPAQGLTIVAHLATGILLTVGVAIGG
jgi:1,4-dihydroxy-2-naphthoate octaprenyltransferase